MENKSKFVLILLLITGMLLSGFAMAQQSSSATGTPRAGGYIIAAPPASGGSTTVTQTTGTSNVQAFAAIPPASATPAKSRNSPDRRYYVSSTTIVSSLNESAPYAWTPSWPTSVIVSEVNSRGYEHIGLFNTGDDAANLDGCRLNIENSASFIFPPFDLEPGKEVEIFFGKGIPSQDALFAGLSNADVLNDDTGTIDLLDSTGNLISSTIYTSSKVQSPVASATPCLTCDRH